MALASVPAFHPHMSLDEATQLNVNDSVDYRLSTGQCVLVTITAKSGTNLTIKYNDWEYSCDYSTNLQRFAKPESISKRSAHRFEELKLQKDDLVDINPIIAHPGWKPAVIKKMDALSGQIQVQYEHDNKNYIYWTHLDNEQEIAPITSKTVSASNPPNALQSADNEMLNMALQMSMDENNNVEASDVDRELQAALALSMAAPDVENCEGLDDPESQAVLAADDPNSNAYNPDVIEQLVNLGFDRQLCIQASAIVIDYNDINRVADQVQILRDIHINEDNKSNEDVPPSAPSDAARPNNKMKTFMSELEELIGMIQKRLDVMEQQDHVVDALISSSSSSSLLQQAKVYALKREKDLLEQIMNLHEIDTFLTSIILIENMFNAEYNPQQREKQKSARTEWARNIANYENKQKPISEVDSFVELLFAGTNLHLGQFENWLSLLEAHCMKRQIRIVNSSGAKGKKIERAFYKAFYVYGMKSNDGFKKMTDVLRCSLVFDNFDDLYKCFEMIERLSRNIGHILRCKDRFNPKHVQFGYRDLLINVYCPGSKIVCEIQLHHSLFYQHKSISHGVYKKARLFEKNGTNAAYDYAKEHFRPEIGKRIYKLETEEKEPEMDDTPQNWLKKWGLQKYATKLLYKYGYNDVDDWVGLTLKTLRYFGFSHNDAKKFEMEAKKMHNDPVLVLERWGLEEYQNELLETHSYHDINDWKWLNTYRLQGEMNFKQGHASKFMRCVKQRNAILYEYKNQTGGGRGRGRGRGKGRGKGMSRGRGRGKRRGKGRGRGRGNKIRGNGMPQDAAPDIDDTDDEEEEEEQKKAKECDK
eukprot:705068_1